MLGDRWNVAPEIGHHSLTTSTKERLAPRVDRDARQQLSETFSAILEGHEKDPVPAHALQALALAAGDEALVELLPALQKLSAALPPEAEEDREFAALEKRFAQDHFGNPLADEPEEHKKAYARLQELRDKREFLPSAILRKPLSGTIARLRLVEKPSDLMNAAANDPARSNWALTQLRRVDPEAWSVIVASQFRDADTQSRRVIFGTLAAGNSDAAKRVVAGIDSAERLELIIEIARFHRRNDKASLAGDLPVLMTLVRDSAQDYIRRGEAMEILSEADLPPAMLEDLVSLLADEIGNPQKGQYGMSTLNHAVLALARISQSTEHLERIMSTPQVVKEAFNAGFEAILRMTGDREDRKQLLADFIRPRFSESDGMMNDLFLKALTHDLRELAPEIAAFASESPAVPDGDAANYSGGRFKTPIGQRYHIAREITALGSEGDPITVSRMWPFFIAAHASSFDPERGDPSLRELAAKQIRNLAADQRRKAIKTAVTLIPIPAYASASESWLRELASD